MAIPMLGSSDCRIRVSFVFHLIILLSSNVLGATISVPGGNPLLSRQNGFDSLFGDDSSSTGFLLASASPDSSLGGFASDPCTFSVEGCPLTTEDPNSLVLAGGLTDKFESGGCDQGLGDCTSLFNDQPTTFNLESSDLLAGNVDLLASDVPVSTNEMATMTQDQQPRIYYDCLPDYTSCIIYDRQNPKIKIKADIHCPPDAIIGNTRLADVNSALFAVPGAQCEFCFENGMACEILDCDVSTFPSYHNNWGQPWGRCQDPTCSCASRLKAVNDAAIQLVASSDESLGWFS